jgi:hypothetical protein
MSPFEFYDASAPVPDHGRGDEAPLGELSERAAERELDAALVGLTDLLADISARELREPLPDELLALLRELTGADSAPLAWASLNRRVRESRTSWEAFWADPLSEEDGMSLVHAVLSSSRRSLQDGLDAQREP